jgi:hypothetical protein
VVEAAGKLSCKAALIDGKIIVQDENGISDFDALRSAIQGTTSDRVLCLRSPPSRRRDLVETSPNCSGCSKTAILATCC